MIVYKITNKVTGKCYIGQTRYSLAHRWYQHTRADSHCSILSASIKKHGKEQFSREILGTYDADNISDAEVYFIDYFNSVSPNGYNITSGGEGASMTEETKRKLSDAQKGPKHWGYGKKQSEETKAKRSAALKGRKRDPEVIARIKANHNPKSDLNLTYRRKVAV